MLADAATKPEDIERGPGEFEIAPPEGATGVRHGESDGKRGFLTEPTGEKLPRSAEFFYAAGAP